MTDGSLTAGSRFGVYEIIGVLGAGGMGEVYRARDTSLNREVALKVLPAAFIADPDRMARFKREAQILASLNHPNIAAIHGLEESSPIRALVLELVEGPTLADRIAAGPVAIDEVLPIARQIADALSAAHQQHIIHRDLKPANIKLTPAGTVKVLDFGLAKAVEGGAAVGALTMSPTITSPGATAAGIFLGTAPYMSPEQARGRVVDKRTDVWAFGCVLFELLAGTRAFQGDDVSATIAEVIKGEPNWTRLPDDVPDRVVAVIKACLVKDPHQRLHDVADARLLIDGAFATSTAASSNASLARWRVVAIALAAASVLAAVGAVMAWPSRPTDAPRVMRSAFTLPADQRFTNTGRRIVAISPDGQRMAYVANSRLYLRALTDLTSSPIAGAETQSGLLNPVFSPDGQSIAYWSADDSTIKRIGIGGGAPVTIGPAERPFGLSWDGDVLLFGQSRDGIQRVSASGGQPATIIKVAEGEVPDMPQMLPGGDAVLFTVTTGPEFDRWEHGRIVAQRLTSADRKVLVEGASAGTYLPSGHLVYAREGVLFAVPFDARTLTVTGGAVSVVEGIRRTATPEVNSGAAQFSFAADGTMIYVPGPLSTGSGERKLAFTDRKGAVTPLTLPLGDYESPRISPEDASIAYTLRSGNDYAIYVHQLTGGAVPRRLTFRGQHHSPVWSPDGTRIAFQSDGDGVSGVFVQVADGSKPAERLTTAAPGIIHSPEAWSPNGSELLYVERNNTSYSLRSLSVADKREQPFRIESTAAYPSAVYSPDGRWLAFRASDLGATGLYVQSTTGGARYEILARGGQPLWSRDGREIYSVASGQIEVFAVKTSPSFTVSRTSVIPLPNFRAISLLGGRGFDVTKDGRFIGVLSGMAPETPVSVINVIVNWFEDVKAKLH